MELIQIRTADLDQIRVGALQVVIIIIIIITRLHI